jgi:hypothetical protein
VQASPAFSAIRRAQAAAALGVSTLAGALTSSRASRATSACTVWMGPAENGSGAIDEITNMWEPCD